MGIAGDEVIEESGIFLHSTSGNSLLDQKPFANQKSPAICRGEMLDHQNIHIQISIQIRLLQCSLRGAAFEDGSEAAACAKCSSEPVLARLHWLPIRFRAQFKVLVLTYKALHGLGPQHLTERLSRHEPTRTLRSTSKVLL